MCGLTLMRRCFSLVDQKRYQKDLKIARGTVKKKYEGRNTNADQNARVSPQKNVRWEAWEGVETEL